MIKGALPWYLHPGQPWPDFQIGRMSGASSPNLLFKKLREKSRSVLHSFLNTSEISKKIIAPREKNCGLGKKKVAKNALFVTKTFLGDNIN